MAISSEELLQKLLGDCDNEDILREVDARLADATYKEENTRAIHTLLGVQEEPPDEGVEDTEDWRRKPKWHNCIGQQTCYPKEIRKPTSLQDLVNAVNEGRQQKLHVRAVGSGHSFSDVCPTDGILLDPHGMDNVLKVDQTLLSESARGLMLFSVESGITVKKLNEALDKNSLALENMGAYSGQTLAGAISTGTHGTGAKLGPMASSVLSLTLVSKSGKIYQIEPTNGITDPAKFAASKPGIILKQDNDWFNSSVVAMGCMGLIYCYTLKVVPAFLLDENRSLCTWEQLRGQMLQKSACCRHYEIDVNPYLVGGVHSCIEIVRICGDTPIRGSRGIANWISGLLASWPIAGHLIVAILNADLKLCRNVINGALKTLVDSCYVNKSYLVMDLGPVDDVKAMALELSFEVNSDLPAAIDNVLAVFGQLAAEKGWYLAGPIALRFVAASDAYLAPQEGRPTCMVECDLLVGIKNGPELLKEVKNRICVKGSNVRVHWGLDLDTVTAEEVGGMFPKFERWLSVYHQLNTTGMFNNAFTDRLRISTSTAQGN